VSPNGSAPHQGYGHAHVGWVEAVKPNANRVSTFPHAIGSSWVYGDADGNQFTRRAVKAEEIEGKTYRAFTYKPAVEAWADYEYYLQPYFYQGGEDSVAFFVSFRFLGKFSARFPKNFRWKN